ncbi:MAG TPA: outer membrane protein assembly factor BamA [Chthoniobacterales bacterium]|nr:outer membrane protein assembly factor BamA [Chthoniobacterales bacterium]
MKHFFSLGRSRLLLLLLGAAALCVSHAQAQGVEGATVNSIDVTYVGPQTVSKDRVLANMRTKVGSPYSETTVEEDIRGLYATGKVQNVRIYGEPQGNGVHVQVILASRALVTEIEIDGAQHLTAKAVRKQIKFKLPGAADAEKLEEGRQAIVDYYESKGFTGVTVDLQLVNNEAKATARAVYTINEGARGAVRNISFQGNQHFTDRKLRSQMKTKAKTFISFLDKSGRLDQTQLQQDLDSIRGFYQNHGYIDVAIPEVRQERTSKGLNLVIVINEGVQYHVRKLNLVGEQETTEAKIRQILKMKEGAIYSPEGLSNDTKAMVDGYGAGGFVDVDIQPEGTPVGTGLVDLSYHITEGNRSFVERVNIVGNTRTKDKVIRREILVIPGDVFNTVRVDTSKKRLENLNYFEKVETYPQDTAVPGRKDLLVQVEEKRTGSLQFGAGYSSIESLLGFVEFDQSNFDLTNYPSFTGGGEKFRARAQFGSETQDYLLSLEEPYFLNHRLSVGGQLFYDDEDYLSTLYIEKDYGVSVNARTPIGPFAYASLTYRLEDIDIANVDPAASEFFQEEAGTRLKSEITPSFVYDTRDNVFLTRHGRRIVFTPHVAGGPLGGDVQTYGFDAVASQYFLLPLDNILLLNGEVAEIDTWGSGTEVPIFDRLYLGGANDLRGFQFRDVSPRDSKNESIGGRSLARFTIEDTFPVITKVRLAVFADTGFVNANAYDFGLNAEASDIGVGVRLDLPIGPVRIDYGFPIQGTQFGNSGQFNFNVGYQF